MAGGGDLSDLERVVTAFASCLHVWADRDGIVTIECNHCSTLDYVFSEGTSDSSSLKEGWHLLALKHMTEQHAKYFTQSLRITNRSEAENKVS